MQKQADISRRRLARRVGHTLEVLVDDVQGDEAVARSMGDAPEIDGLVRIREAGQLSPGEFVDVIVESSDDYDLSARLAP
jgi:ribosomal protein S12 methylthiotransferase